MKIVQLLEQLAIHVPHHAIVEELKNKLSHSLKKALVNSDSDYLKKQFTNASCLADETTVVQI